MSMLRTLTEQLKGELLERHLNEKGVRFHPGRAGWQKVSCYGEAHPRGDRNPSASINLSVGYYKCFGCGKEGDVISLIMEEEGVDFKNALARLGFTETKKMEVPEWI